MIATRVLLVEDDAFLREIYSDTLTGAGYTVSTAEDGQSARFKIKEGNWDILLLDIILPQQDGIEIMKGLRADPEFEPQLTKPVIFLTNLDSEEEKKQALTMGKGYIVKSQIEPNELIIRIQELLKAS